MIVSLITWLDFGWFSSWPWIFKGQIWNLLYLSHELEIKHIDWTLGLKCDHRVWPWPWPWPTIFKVKYGIYYIWTKCGPIATKQKETNWLNSRPQMWPVGLTLAMTLTSEFSRSYVTLTFDHTHGLNQGFSWSNFEIAVSQNGMADWHWTKGLGEGHSWPSPWPFGDQGQMWGSTS